MSNRRAGGCRTARISLSVDCPWLSLPEAAGDARRGLILPVKTPPHSRVVMSGRQPLAGLREPSISAQAPTLCFHPWTAPKDPRGRLPPQADKACRYYPRITGIRARGRAPQPAWTSTSPPTPTRTCSWPNHCQGVHDRNTGAASQLVKKLQSKLRAVSTKSFSLVKELRAHILPLTNCAFNKSGDKFITGSYDRTCKVFDTDTGEEIHTLEGHKNVVYAIAFNNPYGDKIITGSFDKTCKLWDANTGECYYTLRPHGRDVCLGSTRRSPSPPRWTTPRTRTSRRYECILADHCDQSLCFNTSRTDRHRRHDHGRVWELEAAMVRARGSRR